MRYMAIRWVVCLAIGVGGIAVTVGSAAAASAGSPERPVPSTANARVAAAKRASRVVLLGVRTLGPKIEGTSAGDAEAFRFTGARGGQVSSISVYVARGTRAKRLVVGLYANRRGRPSARLTTGSVRAPKRGAWDVVRVRTIGIRSGDTYWIAVLGRGGRLRLRGRSEHGCTTVLARRRGLSALPSAWASRRRVDACAVSVHVIGTATPQKPTSKPAPPTTTTPAPTGGGGPTPTDCAGKPGSKAPDYASMDTCGFPSPDTVGVPAGTALTPVASAHLPAGASWSGGELDISGNNITIAGLNIDGNIHITGENDTLEDSFVSGTGDPEVLIYDGAINTLIKSDEVEAPNAYTGAINNANGEPAEIIDSYIHDNCTAWLGPGNITNNYLISDVDVGGDCHNEAIYVPGNNSTTWPASPWGPAGPAYTDIQHNTLLNPFGQTAAVFLDNHASGPNHNVTENDNLMAGGGYVTYGDSNGDGSTNIVITNNRFSRLYYSDGGYYGVEDQNNAATTFSGNIWDDTLAAVRPNS